MSPGRQFLCLDCRQTMTTPTTTGKLPKHCDDCRPDLKVHRERVRSIREERDRLRQATQTAAGANERARRFGNPGRQALARAIRCVGTAQGARGTAEALHDLAAVATAWAAALSVSHEPSPDHALGREVA